MKGAYENGVLLRVFFLDSRRGAWAMGGYSAKEPTATGSKVPFFQEKISLVAA
jgi:hypothetical protein